MIVVMGNGRCGTNILLEILRGSKELNASKIPEDKTIFKRKDRIQKNYLTKSDINYCDIEDIKKTIKNNPDIKILWMIRNPKDMCLSKIYRGQPGHDCSSLADDATFEGCMKDMNKMFRIYKELSSNKNVKLVKMEDLLLSIENKTKEICRWIGINYQEDMKFFYKRMRNKQKAKRYKNIDLSVIDIWKRWKTIHNGWFKEKKNLVKKIFENTKEMVTYFGY